MKKEVKEQQRAPDEVPEPAPTITPEMIGTAFRALETQGMIYYGAGGVYIPTERGWKLLMEAKPRKEEIVAYGHPDIAAQDNESVRITRSNEIEPNCIAVKANKACEDLGEEFKTALKTARKVEITIEANGLTDKLTAYGSPALKLVDEKDVVIRKNDFIDKATLAILADKSANELKQDLVEKLKSGNTKVKITLEIK